MICDVINLKVLVSFFEFFSCFYCLRVGPVLMMQLYDLVLGLSLLDSLDLRVNLSAECQRVFSGNLLEQGKEIQSCHSF